MDQPFSDTNDTFDAYARHIAPAKVDYYRELGLDLVMGDRHGPYFEDAFSGRQFFNCHSNGGVFNLGHRNQRVIDAVRGALDTIDVGNHHLVSGIRAQLAARLSATTEDRLPGVVFAAAGGEAMDVAIKTARGFTGRPGIVSVRGGYHGHTGLAMAAGDEQYREPFGPNLPGFIQVPFDNIEALNGAVSDSTAAVVVEPIPATLGMPIPSDGYLHAVWRLCRKRGALMILDEVQTGLGRTGTMWAFEQEEFCPDLLVTGKGLSGGIYPMAATLMSKEVFTFFGQYPFVHLSTFGGSEVGCAAATTVLDIVEEPGFLERVNELAERFTAGLDHMPFEFRQRGMMMGFKFPIEAAGIEAARKLFDAGVFTVFAGNDTSALQFLPPLTITDEEADHVIGVVQEVLG